MSRPGGGVSPPGNLCYVKRAFSILNDQTLRRLAQQNSNHNKSSKTCWMQAQQGYESHRFLYSCASLGVSHTEGFGK